MERLKDHFLEDNYEFGNDCDEDDGNYDNNVDDNEFTNADNNDDNKKYILLCNAVKMNPFHTSIINSIRPCNKWGERRKRTDSTSK